MRAFLLRGRDVYSEDLKGGQELERQKECALGGEKQLGGEMGLRDSSGEMAQSSLLFTLRSLL